MMKEIGNKMIVTIGIDENSIFYKIFIFLNNKIKGEKNI